MSVPIPRYIIDRRTLASRAAIGEDLHDDPPAVERLMGGEFLDVKGNVTAKGTAALQEMKRLVIEERRPARGYPFELTDT